MTTVLLFAIVFLGAVFFALGPIAVKAVLVSYSAPMTIGTASVFFVESSTPETLKQTVVDSTATGKKPRILIVPGHDNEFWGTQFGGVKEADMTLELGKQLYAFLGNDRKFDVILARDDFGYNSALASYFSSQEQEILDFAHDKKQVMTDLISAGKIAQKTDGVYHNTAPNPVVVRLYGINKWANENGIDLVVHIHFNDYPRRKKTMAGEYSGFVVYVPEAQYSNSRASRAIADSVSKQLQVHYPESNLKKESAGVVEDQDLIAIGSFNTLDPASILIEYGYIYEPQFRNAGIRSKIIGDLAMQTFTSIRNFFENDSPSALIAEKFNTPLLPYNWTDTLAPGVKYDDSILSLQVALTAEGVYPPKTFDPHECPLSGTYGGCTKTSLALFQKKYNLASANGFLDLSTIAKLNELYGE